MPDLRRSNCQRCSGHRDDVGNISWSGLCERCGVEKASANLLGLIERSGPEYQHWARRLFLAMRRELVASEQGDA